MTQNYPSATDGGVAYARQRDILKETLQKYGADNVAGITVGNEFILKYVTLIHPVFIIF
jgi:exo-beta-1,3-glucanase (GH17 family)